MSSHGSSVFGNKRWQRCAVIGLLPEGFLEQDDTADELTQTRSCQYQVPVTAAMFFSGFNTDRLETFRDSRAAFIGGKNTFSLPQ